MSNAHANHIVNAVAQLQVALKAQKVSHGAILKFVLGDCDKWYMLGVTQASPVVIHTLVALTHGVNGCLQYSNFHLGVVSICTSHQALDALLRIHTCDGEALPNSMNCLVYVDSHSLTWKH